MPNGDPWDGFFLPTLTLIKDFYDLFSPKRMGSLRLWSSNSIFSEEICDHLHIGLLYKEIELFALCKGGNFNIHIWAWFGYFIC